ncbi:MAG: hypothetical protein HY394_01455 [Candidatus Diapherotrites archaeon]|nr:hypothetical protein [Candidatus Diapherotrites archaeon]
MKWATIFWTLVFGFIAMQLNAQVFGFWLFVFGIVAAILKITIGFFSFLLHGTVSEMEKRKAGAVKTGFVDRSFREMGKKTGEGLFAPSHHKWKSPNLISRMGQGAKNVSEMFFEIFR